MTVEIVTDSGSDIEQAEAKGSVPKVVEKGIGMSYPIGKPTNRKGGYTDGERIPQRTKLTMADLGLVLEELWGQPLEVLSREGARLVLTVAMEEEVTEFLQRRHYKRRFG